MPVIIDDTSIRAQLHADAIESWELQLPSKIYDSPQFIPSTKNDLPIVFIELNPITPERGGYTAGLGQVSMWHTYIITGMFPWPENGSVEEDKVVKLQAFASQITSQANFRYTSNNYNRDIKDFTFDTSGITEESKEHYYTVSITFAVEVISAA